MLKNTLSLILAVCILLWIGFIFGNSADGAEESGNKSSHVQEVINNTAQNMGIPVEVSEHSVRKSAHFTEYAVLSLLLCLFAVLVPVSGSSGKLTLARCFSVFLCPFFVMPVAALDETLQKFSEGRGCRFTDVLIDTAGALCAAVLFCLIALLCRYFLRRREAGKNSST